ncbi:MAG: 16S rRNA (adenine(1518)-N(6)/adenine(1519)-N(6))-dimethyltransferase RsmA [Coriobacteriales bacterium]|jgi:16S rRNA (adenine1518-N6/adenine1519-N6)-dimethyltransferase|nr:16S rRNA (adenine(1518)-N(6)/adenine(1519)-N(6))-dimethyltransferase RsmA [Coriobacteriales bacterium]
MTTHSPLATPSATIAALQRWGLSTNKSLGQHFLIDDGVIGRILRLADLSAGESVLEVGPGIGTLTLALLQAGARVTAIEKDEKLLIALAELRARYPQQFSFLHADALSLLSAPSELAGTAPTALVANLPYAVAATIVLDCFLHLPAIASATVMVQAEVAARMAAQPGGKDYGAYSVKLQLLAQPKGSFKVSRQSFLPPPRVDSTVLRLDRLPDCPPADIPAAFTVIEAAFAARRKTIRNSMRSYFSAQGLAPDLVDELLAAARIAPTARGETVSVAQFCQLGQLLTELDTDKTYKSD